MSISEKLVTIAENQQKVYDAGKESVVNELKEAQKGTASGEVVSITDISPIEHNMGVKVEGKNLIKFPYYIKTGTSQNGIEAVVNEDGSITINGTATKRVSLGLDMNIKLEIGETYTFSGCSGGSGATYNLFLQDSSYKQSATSTNSPVTITTKYNSYYSTIVIESGVTVENVVIKPMIEKGTKATPYTPFVEDVSKATLKAQGKNWFNNDTSLIKEVNYIVDGAEAKRFGYEILLPVGTYTIRAIPKKTFNEIYIYGSIVDESNVRKQAVNTVANTTLNTITFNIENGDMLKIYNGVGGHSISETQRQFKMFDFQLEVGESATPYEPYKEPTSYTPNADGTVEGVKSIYPSTTLMADTSGVLVECEYIKDLNAVVGELTDAILSIGGDI